MQEHGSETAPLIATTDEDGDLRSEIRGRAQAVLAELQVEHPDWDTISELALGAHEAVERAL